MLNKRLVTGVFDEEAKRAVFELKMA